MPVTHAEYKQFIDANPEQYPRLMFTSKMGAAYGTGQARTFPPDKANHPVVLVSWHDAQAYANRGKRLPTEEEWRRPRV